MTEKGKNSISRIRNFEMPCTIKFIYRVKTICITAGNIRLDKSLKYIFNFGRFDPKIYSKVVEVGQPYSSPINNLPI
jgi:hypothetical protein